ncbi:MAG: pimeloyl-ACP methyl ester esterase BioH [Gammaproteobacteria bacterium]|nr:pimeloyl-ACP methyl ester esterase BioH [Gammaproteobacteria bacterium]MDH5653226.1 pimeloyl-ACP methyl ester esterase BioH [Gammaproteobacteria bacterium]
MNPDHSTQVSRIYIESAGSGPDLVLLHGWGMHGGYWQGMVAELANTYRVHVVDLPGHGHSPYQHEQTLDDFAAGVVKALSEQVTAPVFLMGWSLGGLIAQQITASSPQLVQRLLLVASSPSFIQREGWAGAMTPEVLQGFADNLALDYRGTLSRFLALQVRGSEQQQQALRELRQQMYSRGEPDLQGLRVGLSLLRDVDLRSELSQITQPVCLLAGERDTLVPASVCEGMQSLLAQIETHVIPRAGHAPFLSHPALSLDVIKAFFAHA